MTKREYVLIQQANLDDLLRCGLTHLKLRTREEAEAIERSFRWLCKQPMEYRARWTDPDPAEVHDGQPDLGYRRVDDDKKREYKSIWHFHPKLLKHIEQQKLIDCKETQELVEASTKLYDKTNGLTNETAEHFGIRGTGTVPSKLRGALYDPPRFEDLVVAQPHLDRCAFTVHIYESHAGLMVAENDDYGHDMPKMRLLPRAHDDQVHLFASAKATWLNPSIPPVWHGGSMPVVGEDRFALILFGHSGIPNFPVGYFNAIGRGPIIELHRKARAA